MTLARHDKRIRGIHRGQLGEFPVSSFEPDDYIITDWGSYKEGESKPDHICLARVCGVDSLFLHTAEHPKYSMPKDLAANLSFQRVPAPD